MPIFDALKVMSQLVPLIYAVGTQVRRAVREIDQDDTSAEIAYVILDAVEAVCRDVRDALPPRAVPKIGAKLEKGEGDAGVSEVSTR